jgi:PST family polysaccharide transporter
LGVALIAAGAGIWGLIAQQVLMQAVGSAFLWATCHERPRLRFGLPELKELAGFGGYALGSLCLGFGVKRLFTLAAGVFLGVELAGYLNLSFRTIDVFWAIASTAATQVALPLLASLQQDVPRLKRAFQAAMSLVCLILYSSFLGIGVLAPELVQVMFGPKWLPSAPYVTALSCLVVVQAPRTLVTPLLTALGRPKDLLLGKVAELAFIAAAIAATRLPSLGWAVGIWIAREVVALPLNVWQLWRASRFSVAEQFRGALMPLVAALGMAGLVLTIKHTLPVGWGNVARLTILVPLGAGSFALIACLLGPTQVKSLVDFGLAAVGKSARAAGREPRFAAGRSS